MANVRGGSLFGEDGCMLGVMGFCSAAHSVECGANGLPLTPNAVRIYGEAQRLKKLRHPNVAQFIEVVRGDQDRMYWITEHYEIHAGHLVEKGDVSGEQITDIARGMLQGLAYLHSNSIVSRNVSLETTLITASGRVVLSNTGLYYATEMGASVAFPIGDVLYMAPELVVRGPYNSTSSTPKEDVWATGVVLIQLALRSPLWPFLRSESEVSDPLPILMRILEYHTSEVLNSEQRMTGNFALRRLRTFATGTCEPLSELTAEAASIIAVCLNPTAKYRPTSLQLLSHPGFPPIVPAEPISDFWAELRCSHLKSAIADLELGEVNVTDHHGLRLSARNTPSKAMPQSMRIAENPLTAWQLEDVYYLWSLLDISLHDEYVRKGYIVQPPAINRLAKLSRPGEKDIKSQADQSRVYSPKVYMLDTSALAKRLHEADLNLFPSVIKMDGVVNDETETRLEENQKSSQELPLLIRERDLDYQHFRMQLYRRLLRGYPFTKDQLLKEARIDIPTPIRIRVWAAILDVPDCIGETYRNLDKEAPGETDHQLSLDIPRCHQYDMLLSSPVGHRKFKRVLKAWILSNPDLVYWQGLDSVCAPFLVSSINDEAMAYGCLHNFIRNYLGNFFLKDNSQTMQECLAIFVQMICYHDPQLGYHLHSICFIPELFAIPWFLTCFAHVFPLEKIMHIFDSLMQSGPSMVILIGVAILMDIRDVLLSKDFEQCILLFGDAPDVDVEAINTAARGLYRKTWPSMCARQFSGIPGGYKLRDPGYQVPDIITLKSQICPCLSIHDFMELVVLGGGVSNAQDAGHAPALAIDIRPASDYLAGALDSPNVNIPFDTAFLDSGDIKDEHLQTLRAWKGKPLVIVENRAKNAPQFAEALIRAHMPRVCILNGGASALRMQGLLISRGSHAQDASKEFSADIQEMTGIEMQGDEFYGEV